MVEQRFPFNSESVEYLEPFEVSQHVVDLVFFEEVDVDGLEVLPNTLQRIRSCNDILYRITIQIYFFQMAEHRHIGWQFGNAIVGQINRLQTLQPGHNLHTILVYKRDAAVLQNNLFSGRVLLYEFLQKI